MSNLNINNLNPSVVQNVEDSIYIIKLEDEYTVNNVHVKNLMAEESFGFCVRKSNKKYLVTVNNAVENVKRITKYQLKIIADNLSFDYLKYNLNNTLGEYCRKRNDYDFVENDYVKLKSRKIIAEKLSKRSTMYQLNLLDVNKYIGISVLSFKEENNENCLNLADFDMNSNESVYFLVSNKNLVFNLSSKLKDSNYQTIIFPLVALEYENPVHIQIGYPLVNTAGNSIGIVMLRDYASVHFLSSNVIKTAINDIEQYNRIVFVRRIDNKATTNILKNEFLKLFLTKIITKHVIPKDSNSKLRFYTDEKNGNYELIEMDSNELAKYDHQICGLVCEDRKYYNYTQNEIDKVPLKGINKHIYNKCENDYLERMIEKAVFEIEVYVYNYLYQENDAKEKDTELSHVVNNRKYIGFCVNHNNKKYIITNYRTIDESMHLLDIIPEKFKLKICQNKTIKVKNELKFKAINDRYQLNTLLIESNKHTSISVLEFDKQFNAEITCFNISEEQPKVNDENIVVNDFKKLHLTRGFIENSEYERSYFSLFHHLKSEALNNYNSFPLLNNKSEVIGYLNSFHTHHSLFIPQNYLLKVLENIEKYRRTIFFYPHNLHTHIQINFNHFSTPNYNNLTPSDRILSIKNKNVSDSLQILNALFLNQPKGLFKATLSENSTRYFYYTNGNVERNNMIKQQEIRAFEINDDELKHFDENIRGSRTFLANDTGKFFNYLNSRCTATSPSTSTRFLANTQSTKTTKQLQHKQKVTNLSTPNVLLSSNHKYFNKTKNYQRGIFITKRMKSIITSKLYPNSNTTSLISSRNTPGNNCSLCLYLLIGLPLLIFLITILVCLFCNKARNRYDEEDTIYTESSGNHSMEEQKQTKNASENNEGFQSDEIN